VRGGAGRGGAGRGGAGRGGPGQVGLESLGGATGAAPTRQRLRLAKNGSVIRRQVYDTVMTYPRSSACLRPFTHWHGDLKPGGTRLQQRRVDRRVDRCR
jgi:hypothetical protein